MGAGTVRNPDQLAAATKIGCAFAVSPGFTDRLLDAAADTPCVLLPGAATAAEMMTLADRGFDRQKFFPAGAGWWAGVFKGDRVTPAGYPVLPDRRDLGGHGAPLSGTGQRALRRWLMGRAAKCHADRGLGHDHAARQGGLDRRPICFRLTMLPASLGRCVTQCPASGLAQAGPAVFLDLPSLGEHAARANKGVPHNDPSASMSISQLLVGPALAASPGSRAWGDAALCQSGRHQYARPTPAQ